MAESLQKCKETTEQAILWFKKTGLCVNEQKTEVCVFNKNDVGRHWVELNGLNIEVNKQMKTKLNFNWLMYSKTMFKMRCKKLMINDVLGL